MKLLQLLTVTSLLASGAVFAADIPFPKQHELNNKPVRVENKFIPLKLLGPRPGFAGYYLAAQHAQSEEDWQTANYYFDIVSRKDPANIDLKRRTMVISMGAGDLDMAAEYASDIIDGSPGESLATLFLSAYDVTQQNYKKSLQELAAMEDGGMSRFAVPLIRAWTKAHLGQFDISDFKPQSLDAFHAALLGHFLNEDTKSLEFLNKVRKISHNEPSLKLADAYLVLGEYETAQEIYEDLAKTQPSASVDIRLDYLKTKKDALKPPFLEEISAAQGLGMAYIDMAKILYAEESTDSARIFTQIGLSVAPDLEDGHILLAKIYTESGRFSEAVSHYRKISPQSRYATDVQLKIAEIQESVGQLDNAITGLEGLYEKKPHIDLLVQVGDIFRRAQNYASAVEYYNRALNNLGKETPDDYWFLYYVRGIAQERLGDWKKAEIDFMKALAYRPNDPFVLNYLAYGWAERNENLSKSLEFLEKAVSRRPMDGHIRDSLGWVLYKLGQFENAIDPLEKAISYLPYDPIVNEHLGDAYWQVGRKREALFQWQRALNHVEEGDETVDVKRLREKLISGLPVERNVLAAENKVTD